MKWWRTLIKRDILSDTWAMTVFIIALLIALHIILLLLPRISILPSPSSLIGYSSTIWQVHAATLAFTAIVLTIIVTVIASRQYIKDTWDLYVKTSKFPLIIYFNLLALIIYALDNSILLPSTLPSNINCSAGNVIIIEWLIFLLGVISAMYLYVITFKFFDSDYIEDLSERETENAIRMEVQKEYERLQRFSKR